MARFAAHPKCRLEQVANGYRTATAIIRGLRFQLDDMRETELKFSSVFNDDDTFVPRSHCRKGVEKRRLACTASTRHDHVVLLDNCPPE